MTADEGSVSVVDVTIDCDAPGVLSIGLRLGVGGEVLTRLSPDEAEQLSLKAARAASILRSLEAAGAVLSEVGLLPYDLWVFQHEVCRRLAGADQMRGGSSRISYPDGEDR